ncbi:MAG: hypothetical protein LUC24_05330 [Bacteroidales bacterium]|nr:hypothetical protein [Bacteroidales bacterium]
MALTDPRTAAAHPELVAIRDDYNRLARRHYTLTRETAPDGQFLYTVLNEAGEPVNSLLTPDSKITSMTVFGRFAFHGYSVDFLKGSHLRAWNKTLKVCREAEAAGDEERLLHGAIALSKLTILACLNE